MQAKERTVVISSESNGNATIPSKRKRSRDSRQCYAFKRKGTCVKGSECKFRHGISDSKTNSDKTDVVSENVTFMEAIPDSDKYIERRQKVSSERNINKHQERNHQQAQNRVRGQDLKEDDVHMEVANIGIMHEAIAHMTSSVFSDLDISVSIKKALSEVLKYTNMTLVQESTLNVILSGADCLAKAKTGTGKTLAFLIPSIEKILQSHKEDLNQENMPISTLILSPTRELALQIANEAEQLLHFSPSLRTLCLVGGTNMKKDVRLLNDGAVAILVATPGRLLDHLENTPGISGRLNKTKTVVLDEADNLLDMGFKPTIDKIFRHLSSREKRQTLLFSATVPNAVRLVAKEVLLPGYVVVDTVGDVVASQTHEHVAQEIVTVTMNDVIPAVVSVLQREIDKGEVYKIIVFFNTARVTGYMAGLLRNLQCPVLDIHSRMTQNARNKTSERFRDAKRAILFSSDVSARGMDYPDVTFVLQVGLTDKDQYTHRLGRTARAGKEGAGMLLLVDFEEYHMMRILQGMPLERTRADLLEIEKYRERCDIAVQNMLKQAEGRKAAEQAYGSWLGFYNGNKKNCGGWNNTQLVEAANCYSLTLGFPRGSPPALEKKTIGKMGLKGVAGLRVMK